MIAQHRSASNEHYTPSAVVESARVLLGGFDLDPASCEEANRTVRAKHYYSAQSDGLRQRWTGRVFLNPPGGLVRMHEGHWIPQKGGGAQSSMLVWWEKLCCSWSLGHITEAVFVGFTLEILRLSQRCPLPVQRFPRCYPRERLAFSGTSPTHANVIVYLPDLRKGPGAFSDFTRAFSGLGLCEGGAS